MKWVFYSLLVLNTAYFIWRVKHLESVPASAMADVRVADRVTRLLLLREIEDGELRAQSPVPSCDDVASPGQRPEGC